jgi:hypothetical protein
MAPELQGEIYLLDPSGLILVRVGSHSEYVVYSSHHGLVAHTSVDRVHWTRSATPAFPKGVPWVADYAAYETDYIYTQGVLEGTKAILDPDVQWVPAGTAAPASGMFWMYFAASSGGDSRHSAIGASSTLLYELF